MATSDLNVFLAALNHRRSASAKSVAAQFFAPPSAPSRRPPGSVWAHSPTLRTLSKIVMKRRHLSLQTSHRSSLLLLHLIVNHFGHSIVRLFWEREIPVESVMNHFKLKCHGPERVSWHFPTGHSPLQQRYWQWNPLCWGASDSLLPPTVSPPSPFEKCLYAHSPQGLVMVGLLDNLLNPLKLLLAVTNNFPKWQNAMTKICRGSGENNERWTGYSQPGER